MRVDTFELADLLRHRDRIADVIAVVERIDEFHLALANHSGIAEAIFADEALRKSFNELEKRMKALPQQQPPWFDPQGVRDGHRQQSRHLWSARHW